MRYRAAAPATLRVEPLGELTAVYHRPSGITHLLAEPAPEILVLLADAALTADALMTRLGERYRLADADVAALRARLDELVAAGLVEEQAAGVAGAA